jgi:hypothetical protein
MPCLGLAVDETARLSDLPVGGGLHLDAAHLHHGFPEPELPRPRHVREEPHQAGRARRVERGVGREEHLPVEHVPVVLAVQLVGGPVVLRYRAVGAVVRRRRAGSPQPGGVRGLHVRARGVAGWREAAGEGRAVGAADAVRAGERHHVGGVEPLGGEHLLEPRGVGERRGQVRDGLAGEGDAPVVAARGHGEANPAVAEEAGRVAGGEGHDVRARDRAGARGLELRLGRVDHLEAAKAREVGDAELLRLRVGAGRIEQNGGVATLKNHKCSGTHCHS